MWDGKFSVHARGVIRCAVLLLAVGMMARPARAAFHLWTIQEVYSNNSGTLQFIELHDSSGGQTFIGGQQIRVSNVGNTQTNTFTIPGNLSTDSFNHSLLFGTSGLQAAGGPKPDFPIPNNFLFTAGGSISFFGANSGSYSALPTDGILSRTWNGGNAVNSPTNFAGQTGTVAAPEPMTLGVCGMMGVLLLASRRRRR